MSPLFDQDRKQWYRAGGDVPSIVKTRVLNSVDLGNGTEAIEIQGSIDLKDPLTPKGFLRLHIE